MKLLCVCKKWHDVSPTAMAVVIEAFIDGDLQTVDMPKEGGIKAICMLNAFTEERMVEFRRRYQKNAMKVNGADPVYAATAQEVSRVSV